MSTLIRSRRLRWAVPGAVAAAVAVASLSSTVTASASGQPKLAVRTAAQLLVSLEQAKAPMLSGTIVETTNLGLPDLSGLGASVPGDDSSLSLQTFVSGSHTLRVFYGGPDKQRVALLGSTSESDVVHNGTDLWTYSSSTRAVTHATLKSPSEKPEAAEPSSAAAMTPLAEAQKALSAIDPSTAVDIDRTAYVAGRSAYQILLTPRDTRSLIGSIKIALDSATSVPLRVQVFARGATDPAIQVGFTDVSFGPPDASIFNFTPPAGTTVTPAKLPFIGDEVQATATHVRVTRAAQTGSDSTKVIGSGWTAVVETSAPGGESGALTRIGTPVPGGWIISSALVSVLLTQDGHLYAGAVSTADLQRVAATGKPL